MNTLEFQTRDPNLASRRVFRDLASHKFKISNIGSPNEGETKMPRSKKSASNAQFPDRLHDMMQFVVAQGNESIISWVLGGRGFKIHDPDGLVEILSQFFGQTKYSSFRRQLNMWDFERVVHGPHKGTFMHPYFVRGNRALCASMSRLVRARGRPSQTSITTDEKLGSFQSQVKECSIPLSRDKPNHTMKSNSLGYKSEQGPIGYKKTDHKEYAFQPVSVYRGANRTFRNELSSAYRAKQDTGNTAESLDISCNSEEFSDQSISALAWSSSIPSLPPAKEALILDLEPSRIFDLNSDSVGINEAMGELKGQDYDFHNPTANSLKNESSFFQKGHKLYSQGEQAPSSLHFDVMDFAPNALKNDENAGSFAGKRFFLVESSSHESFH